MRALDAKHFLLGATLLRQGVESWDEHPFNLPFIRSLEQVEFRKPVTFLVGENGSGKSTLLEAIAVAWGFNPEGGSKHFSFSTRDSHAALHRHLRLIRSPLRVRDGFFLRAESFYNVASEIDELDKIQPLLHAYGGVSLHQQSHGESFLSLLLHRLGGRGLYIFDEPEAALSPMRQMTLLARMHQLVAEGSQFLIATHSPMLMAFPDAEILTLDGDQLSPTRLEDTEHFQVTRRFLNDPASMLKHLLEDA